MSRRSDVFAIWTKLRGRSFAELRDRARQRLAVWSERARLSSQVVLPDDRRFSRILATGWTGSTGPTAAAMLERFCIRSTPTFFPAFSQRDDVVAALRRRWPDAEARVIEKAERIREGRFDLLGHSGLDFGRPINWHRDPVSGVQSGRGHWSRIDHLNGEVAGDHKVIWELNRHQYFATLGKAYWYSGDERYAATFVEHMTAWMDENPPKEGINWASSLEVAFRAIAWIWALYFFKGAPSVSEAVFWRILKFLFVHGRHIETYLSTYYSPNTHLTGEALALVYLGTLLPELRDAARWRRLGWSILVEQLDVQVRPDGSYFEQSTCYHRYTADFYLHLTILGRLNALPVGAAIHDKLRALLDCLMNLTQPDGRTPLVGDDDGGRLVSLDERPPSDVRAALATGAVFFRRPDYRGVAGEAAEETLWLLGCDGLRAFDALEARHPPATSRAFRDGGYYVMRDGWDRDASCLLMNSGPPGVLNCGHAHGDALAITLAVRGTAVLVDPGTYTYALPGDLREHFRSSAAHNAVTVAGQSSSMPGGPFIWRVAQTTVMAWTPGARCDHFEALQDGYDRLSPPAQHRRAILALKNDYWVIRDRVVTVGDHDVDLHWCFAPGITLEVRSPTHAVAQWRRDAIAESLELAVFGDPGTLRGDEGWVSSSYGALSRAPRCVFAAHGRGPRDVITFLVPRRRGDDPIRVEERPATNGRAFAIRSQASTDVLLLAEAPSAATGDLSAVAGWTWVRVPATGGLPTEVIMLQGRSVTWRERPLVRADAPVPYIAARREGPSLHVEVDASCPWTVDLLGADRVITRRVAGTAGGAVARHDTSPIASAAPRNGASTPVEVS